jgi:hypothetical protein
MAERKSITFWQTRLIFSSVNSGYSGKDNTSREASSVFGKLPAE